MKTCVISFSSRADGNCAAIADCVQETLGAEGLTRFDFSGLSVHGCGACHCECFRQREACPYFADDAFRLNEAAALADRGLVSRVASESDGRSHHLTMTKEGWVLYDDIAPAALDLEKSIITCLTDDELRAFVDMMARLRDAADQLQERR